MLTEHFKGFEIRYGQFYQDRKVTKEWEDRTALGWQGLVEFLQTCPIEDGDQERAIQFLRDAGHEVTRQVRADVYRAFDATGLLQASSAEDNLVKAKGQKPRPVPQIEVIKAAVLGDKRVGKKRADRAVSVLKSIADKKTESALTRLHRICEKGPFKVLGLIAKDNCNIMLIDRITEWWLEYVAWWHVQYDASGLIGFRVWH